MDDILGVKILDAEADVDEDFPDQIVHKRFHDFASARLPLPLYHSVQIPDRTVLKDDMYFLIIYERVDVSHDIRRVKTAHDLYFIQGLNADLLWDLGDVYDLDDIVLILE